MHTIRTLLPWEAWRLKAHLRRLDDEDRRLRFGYAISDAALDTFVCRIDWFRERILVAFDDAGEIIGAVHIAGLSAGDAELAFSVEKTHRRRGLGRALCWSALLWARNRGFRRALTYCVGQNLAMRRLALSCGMRVNCSGGDCEGVIALPAPTLSSWLGEMLGESWAVSSRALAAQRRLLSLLPPRTARVAG